ncbi:MAG: hypothetical protein ACFCD0_24395 [Gemmataceae bacterium]
MTMTPANNSDYVYLVYHIVLPDHQVANEDGRLSQNPVKIFATLVEAQRYVSDCRREGHGMPELNPFRTFAAHNAMYSDLISYPYPVFHDWLLEAEIEPPRDPYETPPISELGDWYDANCHRWTKHQLASVWKVLTKIDPFVIKELELGD